MDIATKIFRFLYRWKWWLIIFPVIAAILVWYMTKDMKRVYTSNTVIYTGVISGYNLETSLSSKVDMLQSNNQMENFINIINSFTTLQNVSLKLYAQHLTYGDTLNDTKYIWASHFQPIYRHCPDKVKALVDHSSYENTLANLKGALKNEYDNYIYGLFMWNYQYYGKETLEKITVSRIKTSDMIEISYTNDDPYVVYNTLLLLNEEFFYQYTKIRDDETDNAIKYFENELIRISNLIKVAEEEQKKFSISKKVVNYEEQTKQIAFIQSNYTLKKQEATLTLNSTAKIIDNLEMKFGKSFDVIKQNDDFVKRLKTVSDLSNQLAISTVFQGNSTDSLAENKASYFALQRDLRNSEKELTSRLGEYSTMNATGEVLISKDIAYEWLQATIQNECAVEELKALQLIEKDIDKMYEEYSPIGIYLKQQERLMSFLEKEYLSVMDNLNQAKLRKKNTQMSTANLKVMAPPQLPLNAEPTKKNYFVAAAGLGTFFFILGILLIMEIIGKTLQDKERAESLTGGKVIAALPGMMNFRYRKYRDEYFDIAIKNLSNSILNRAQEHEMNIVNFISFTPNAGKSNIINLIASHWSRTGKRYRIVNWKEAIDKNDREVMYPINLNDLLSLGTDNIIVVEHRDLSNEIISKEILQKAIINILILDAGTSWKDADKIYYKNLLEHLGAEHSESLFICLTNASKLAVEEFTGQLPPYNFLTNLSHDIYNFGSTSKSR